MSVCFQSIVCKGEHFIIFPIESLHQFDKLLDFSEAANHRATKVVRNKVLLITASWISLTKSKYIMLPLLHKCFTGISFTLILFAVPFPLYLLHVVSKAEKYLKYPWRLKRFISPFYAIHFNILVTVQSFYTLLSPAANIRPKLWWEPLLITEVNLTLQIFV